MGGTVAGGAEKIPGKNIGDAGKKAGPGLRGGGESEVWVGREVQPKDGQEGGLNMFADCWPSVVSFLSFHWERHFSIACFLFISLGSLLSREEKTDK
jgi:hypothetical protein